MKFACKGALHGYPVFRERGDCLRLTECSTRSRTALGTQLRPADKEMIVQQSRHIERHLNCSVQLRDLARIACAHQPDQAVARNCEDIVKIRDALHGQSLPAAERHFGGKLTDRSGDQYDDDAADAVENGITGQDYDRSAADWWGQFSPPDLTTFHAPPTFQSEIFGSSAPPLGPADGRMRCVARAQHRD